MTTVTVEILGKPYQVNCPPEQEIMLIEAAKELDTRMKEMKYKGQVVGLERIAVITALNLSYELLRTERQSMGPSDAVEQLQSLRAQVDEELRNIRDLHD